MNILSINLNSISTSRFIWWNLIITSFRVTLAKVINSAVLSTLATFFRFETWCTTESCFKPHLVCPTNESFALKVQYSDSVLSQKIQIVTFILFEYLNTNFFYMYICMLRNHGYRYTKSLKQNIPIKNLHKLLFS